MCNEIPKELLDSVKSNKLIIFVGAGLSVNHGLPSWNKIVLDLLESKSGYIEKSDSYMKALSDEIMTPLEVLEKIRNSKKYILDSFEKSLKIQNLDSILHKKLSKEPLANYQKQLTN